LSLVLFDLDNTLIAGDSDYLWGEFLIEHGHVDAKKYHLENNRYMDQYQAGNLDIEGFLEFSLKPLTRFDHKTLKGLHEQFMEEKIEPIILRAATILIEDHRQKGNQMMIITATNRFITEPIAHRLGISELLATEPELINQRYTGKITGVPCFAQGKVEKLFHWLKQTNFSLQASWFYSDSRNDIPLLEKVGHPVAVDPDNYLSQYAKSKNWDVISLRGQE